MDRYRGEFIYMQEGEIAWHGEDPSVIGSHRSYSSAKPGSALWLKLVDPEETEGERFEVYDRCLSRPCRPDWSGIHENRHALWPERPAH